VVISHLVVAAYTKRECYVSIPWAPLKTLGPINGHRSSAFNEILKVIGSEGTVSLDSISVLEALQYLVGWW